MRKSIISTEPLEGFRYQAEVLPPEEEQDLVARIQELPLRNLSSTVISVSGASSPSAGTTALNRKDCSRQKKSHPSFSRHVSMLLCLRM